VEVCIVGFFDLLRDGFAEPNAEPMPAGVPDIRFGGMGKPCAIRQALCAPGLAQALAYLHYPLSEALSPGEPQNQERDAST
jgi:hypothetical protein